MREKLDAIKKRALELIEKMNSANLLTDWNNKYLGKKGELNQILKSLGSISPEERATIGQLANQIKNILNDAYASKKASIEMITAQDKLKIGFDLSLPNLHEVKPGTVHPVTSLLWEIEDIFKGLGFIVETGPEAESEYYNFEALNIPSWHPAREMQDTFWLEDGRVLRTQTSAVQVRAMEAFVREKREFPLMVIAPGRCFRYEVIDASHENTFHQIEGLMVGKGISVANLIHTMKTLLNEVFGHEVKTRLRPGYFPFVEPGFELDINCQICNGVGCTTCKQSGWIELLPCGMVHPNVLRYGGIDPKKYSGFAFGLGLTRLVMMRYGIDDIRYLNSGDIRVLEQFRRYE